ncbi:DUF1033 family protein [Jeotgalibacillus proteolyticus]|uniref:DUF1033 domain-containing protein n=1 Tax=Jeotgalibacillus proteolyticus TaxID=2082395 RepID=A0A2S5GFM8_9BACL|nr:DUF1033 family protein [Jeotgalibacillus proteolyticus]PPA71840.1 DUF1033 domain-containing protein [Jeotgalibacillus proteolyticus]
MWNIIQTKSDAEPWWFLEGWQEDILQEWTFKDKNEAFGFFKDKVSTMAKKYPSVRVKRGTQIAFWDKEELLFCDACDDDLQLYHGLLLLYKGEPFISTHMSSEEVKFFNSILNGKTSEA